MWLVNSNERFFTSSAYSPPSAPRLMSSKKIPHMAGLIGAPVRSAWTVSAGAAGSEKALKRARKSGASLVLIMNCRGIQDFQTQPFAQRYFVKFCVGGRDERDERDQSGTLWSLRSL